MSRRTGARSLRTRLLAGFALVMVLGAGAAAWSGTRSAGAALLDATQDQMTTAVADQVEAVAPTLAYPPDQDSLDRLRAVLGRDAVAAYADARSTSGAAEGLVTAELRAAVRGGDRLVAQRVEVDGTPWLVVGAPVVRTAPDGARTASGIEVYAARDLTPVAAQVDALARDAVVTSALALPFALGLALLAARSVLRPVRDLRDTARRLADGDLDARSPSLGADELADLAVTVNGMADSLQASMQTMSRMQDDARRFAADVAHELRTPLSTLVAVMDVLDASTEGLEPDARESARLAITETHRLVRLVEDLMEVSRFDAGTADLRLEDVDVADVVRGCLRARGWLDDVELRAPGGVVARLDPRRVDVVLANLVGNALRHGSPPVRVVVGATADDVVVEVTDRGPGLPDDVAVFDRFTKGDAARTRTEGSGLGLAIALENARLHGGELTAGRLPEGGARFVLRVPRRSGEVRRDREVVR